MEPPDLPIPNLPNLPKSIAQAFKSNDVHGAYDYLIENVFSLHIEMADMLANIKGKEFRETVRQAWIKKLSDNLGSHDLYASSYGHIRSHNPEAN